LIVAGGGVGPGLVVDDRRRVIGGGGEWWRDKSKGREAHQHRSDGSQSHSVFSVVRAPVRGMTSLRPAPGMKTEMPSSPAPRRMKASCEAGRQTGRSIWPHPSLGGEVFRRIGTDEHRL